MSRFTLLSPKTASPDAVKRLTAVEQANGFIPNLLGVLANAPTALEAYQTVTQINNRNSLSSAEREVIQMTAAVTNGCAFCVAGHTKIVKEGLQLDGELVEALRQVKTLPDAKLNALAIFTLEVLDKKGQVSDEVLAAFYAAGYGQQQALETVLGVSLATLCNFANNLAQTEINPELIAFA